MDYYKIYKDLIKKGVDRKELPEHYEVHHILPKCTGGGDEVDNLVKLTPREHYIAHVLLTKVYPDNLALKWSVIFFKNTTGNVREGYINSRVYEMVRKEYRKLKFESCQREGAERISLGIKVPAIVSNRTRNILSKDDGKFFKKSTRIKELEMYYRVVLTNLIAKGGLSYSRSSSQARYTFTRFGKKFLSLSPRHMIKIVDKLVEQGYATNEVCGNDIPFPKRKRSAIYATEELYEVFGDCYEECNNNYEKSLVERKIEFTTGEVVRGIPYEGLSNKQTKISG